MDNDGILRLFEGWDKDADIDAKLALKGRSRAENMFWSRTRAAIKEGVPLPKVDAMGNTHDLEEKAPEVTSEMEFGHPWRRRRLGDQPAHQAGPRHV